MDTGRFRSAAFGGFHRQDVLDYIEYSTKDFSRQLEEKQKTIDSLQQSCDSLSGEVARLQERLSETAKAAEDATALRERLSALQEERDTLADRLDEAISRLNRIEPDYLQFEAIKDRVAEIELNAHSHAATIEREAYERAVKIGDELSRTLASVREEYQSLKSCVADASAHFRTDLEKIFSALDRFSGFFGEVENTLDHLLTETQTETGCEPSGLSQTLPESEQAQTGFEKSLPETNEYLPETANQAAKPENGDSSGEDSPQETETEPESTRWQAPYLPINPDIY